MIICKLGDTNYNAYLFYIVGANTTEDNHVFNILAMNYSKIILDDNKNYY